MTKVPESRHQELSPTGGASGDRNTNCPGRGDAEALQYERQKESSRSEATALACLWDLQMGHVELSRSHRSTHSLWKPCLQGSCTCHTIPITPVHQHVNHQHSACYKCVETYGAFLHRFFRKLQRNGDGYSAALRRCTHVDPWQSGGLCSRKSGTRILLVLNHHTQIVVPERSCCAQQGTSASNCS